MRPLKETESGPCGEPSTTKRGSEVPGVAPEVAPNVSARGAWETKWLRGAPATPNPSVVRRSSENHDVETARQIQRQGKLRTMC